jgi:chloramphenicol-sensitive protein RarD
VLWGLFPLYFLLLARATAYEVVSFRVLLSLVFCALLITVLRGWRRIAAIARVPRMLFALALSGVLILANWEIYVIAVDAGQVVDAALGYFITPIVTVLLGVLVLRERLRPLQWVAVGVSVVAIVVVAVGGATVPWVALGLALSFGLYGLVKKRVGPRVDALSGLAIETAWTAPLALVQLAVVASTTGLAIGRLDPVATVALLLAGVITAIPLLMFAGSARRLPLVVLGLAQYIIPTLQFLIGVALLHEVMPLGRWLGFGMVWVALLLLTVDLVAASRRREAVPAPGSPELR